MSDKKIIVNKSLDWNNTWGLAEQAKAIYFERDEENNIKAIPVVIIDPSAPQPIPANGVPIPNVFKTISAATSNQTVWTPASGKTIRLMGGNIMLTKDAACAGLFQIDVYDAAIKRFSYTISNGALVAIGDVVNIQLILPPNGCKFSAANAALSVQIGTLTAGAFSCNMWGVEE